MECTFQRTIDAVFVNKDNTIERCPVLGLKLLSNWYDIYIPFTTILTRKGCISLENYDYKYLDNFLGFEWDGIYHDWSKEIEEYKNRRDKNEKVYTV